MDVAMRINPKDKMITPERMEKWVLRKAFEDELPESVAWRQKEQFSDGVGYNWIDSLKELVESSVTDAQMEQVSHRFQYNHQELRRNISTAVFLKTISHHRQQHLQCPLFLR